MGIVVALLFTVIQPAPAEPDQFSCCSKTLGQSRQVIHTYVPLLSSSMNWFHYQQKLGSKQATVRHTHGGVVVRVLDSRWAGREFDSHAAAALGNNLGQVVHTNVPLFTKQCNLVPCEGFRVNAPVCGSPMNKGSIVVAVLQRSDRLEPRYKSSTLLLLFLHRPRVRGLAA